MSESTFHPSEGGGVGVFSWDVAGPSDVEVKDVAFSGLAGPALYLRGAGRYVMRGCDVQDAGTWPWLPGGVLAMEGVEPWHDPDGAGHLTGLLLEGNSFGEQPGDAILLDGSSGTLASDPGTGLPNTFEDLQGEPLIWQACGGVPAPEVLDGSLAVPSCASPPRSLGPPLVYDPYLFDVEAMP